MYLIVHNKSNIFVSHLCGTSAKSFRVGQQAMKAAVLRGIIYWLEVVLENAEWVTDDWGKARFLLVTSLAIREAEQTSIKAFCTVLVSQPSRLLE